MILIFFSLSRSLVVVVVIGTGTGGFVQGSKGNFPFFFCRVGRIHG